MQLNHSLIFRIINIVVACFMVIGGVATIMTGGFPQFIRGIFCIIFGVMVFVFEFRLPPIVTQYVSYMFSFLGRGIFYIFIGCIILNYLALAIASGVIVVLCGIAFVILEFIPSIEAPSNMRREALDESLSGMHGGRTSAWANNTTTQPSYGQDNVGYGRSAADTGFSSHQGAGAV
ncbi:COPI associated protein-domain-containing protein [Radiomyces spectabilis]|uniref:COPI associated protein-domain-containing protein n=1 Tax=Radiomyces spectabilis TaxID=64574 RepID=UPI002221221D|nr:COPI associated protein-domain-containing protein [Radiomyces spectabilis]KAI8390838.1 COPI associated protein-domain-containing protein [Radiomyces spectabilis]